MLFLNLNDDFMMNLKATNFEWNPDFILPPFSFLRFDISILPSLPPVTVFFGGDSTRLEIPLEMRQPLRHQRAFLLWTNDSGLQNDNKKTVLSRLW